MQSVCVFHRFGALWQVLRMYDVGKPKNSKVAGMDEIIGEMIKGGDRVVYWI